MSVQELAHSLQRKLRSEFPIHSLSETNLNIDEFLSSCFAGKTHNLFSTASLLKQDLQAYLDSTQKSLSHHIQLDFDKLIRIPDLLIDFEVEIQSLHKNATEFCEEINVINQRAKESTLKITQCILSNKNEQLLKKGKQEIDQIEINLNEIESKLPGLKSMSIECMNIEQNLNHGALYERIGKIMSQTDILLKGNYNSLFSQLKSDYLLLISKELVA